MNHSDFGSVFHAGVDYLTVTTTLKRERHLMSERGLRLLRKEELAGYKLKPWTMLGFQGFACGGIQMGEHDGRLLVRLSGELAHENWKQFGELAETCSRLDLQATVRFKCDAMHAIARTYRQAKRNRHDDGKRRSVSLFQSTNGSATVYVGQRVSENYGRVYAKGLETKLPFWENSVRYEAEFKGEQAWRELQRILRSKALESDSTRRVRAFFSLRGVRLRWSWPTPDELDKPSHQLMCADLAKSPRRLSDVDRKLLWLEKSCRGAVQALIEAGHRDRVLVALGLQTAPQSSLKQAVLELDQVV